VDLVDITLAQLVVLYCTGTEFSAVVGLEAANDSGIKGLDKWCEVGPKSDHRDAFWLIGDIVARKVIES
jgi:hypothetical protein